MDYAAKLDRLDKHIKEHPKDYQSVVARMKTYSDAVEHGMYLRRVERMRRLAEIRRKKNGEKQG